MKKIILPIFLFCLLFSNLKTNAQAVRDRGIIPVAVNLNLVLRLEIVDGGNIEFVFNTINDYQIGMGARGLTAGTGANAAIARVGTGVGTTSASAQQFYRTRFQVSASRRWVLNYGAENQTFIGTDLATNTLDLNNVGITMTAAGTHFDLATGVISAPTANFAAANLLLPCALTTFPTVLITDAVAAGPIANTGDELANEFCIFWQCGTGTTGGVTPMTGNSILNLTTSPAADRYVTNVLFELDAL